MKPKEREEARRLRQKEGISIGKIAKKLNVSKSSVSLWVRDIKLTKKQLEALSYQSRNGEKRKQISKKEREKLQKQGKLEADCNNFLHVVGCMLYWAEGWRKNNRNCVSFSNSSVHMLKLFLAFLRNSYHITDDKISIAINCYSDLHKVEKIEQYWINNLGLPDSCLRKTIVDKRPRYTKRKRNGLLEYGTCKMMVYNTEVIQRIYGSIQAYGGFDNSDWLI